jgi:predicted O-linked N-acetylglucosamine transferase (SPINDLY family)
VTGTVPAAALFQQAVELHRRGMLPEADRVYREILRLEPHHFNAAHLRGLIALQTGRPLEAERLLTEALCIQPDNAEALANLGSALTALSRHEEALDAYARALDAKPAFVGPLHNQGVILQLLGRHEEAAVAFRRLFEAAPDFDFAAGNLFNACRQACDWREFESLAAAVVTALDTGSRADQPFSFLSVDDSVARQCRSAQLYAAYLCPGVPAPVWRGERYAHERLRIAYVSADFRGHILAHMMSGVYERHDRGRFETIGISLTGVESSPIVARARAALGQLHDVSAQSDDDAARLLRDLEVDIAVDLTGYTQGCRPGLFARRPAPVQVSLLGFPASMGVPYIDYLIGDEFVIPDSSGSRYAERIARLPECFQANDDRRALVAATSAPSRTDVGLPEDGIVLCCFNNVYKINPAMFTVWTRILHAVPGSILWLLAERPAVLERLTEEAAARGIGAGRLVFADRLSYPEHLARLSLADLFLDTLPFNAGATASDALWCGVPVVTCAGESFAARMGGSLLKAVGLAELITLDAAAYERLAVELGRDPPRLAQYKQRLIADRNSAPLFDSARYCRHLEAAFVRMWERAQRGEPPADFSVPALDA